MGTVTGKPFFPNLQALMATAQTPAAPKSAPLTEEFLLKYAGFFKPTTDGYRLPTKQETLCDVAFPATAPVSIAARLPQDKLLKFAEGKTPIGDVNDSDPELGPMARHSLYKGIECYLNGEMLKAEQHLKGVLNLNPNSHKAYFHLGQVYNAMDNDEEALKAFAKSVQLNPDNPLAIGMLASMCVQLRKVNKDILSFERIDQALFFFKKALELDPKCKIDDWCFHIGYLYASVRCFAEARQYLKASVELYPTNSLAHRTLASLYSVNDQMLDAVALLQRLIKNNPREIYGRTILANYYSEMKWHKQAFNMHRELAEKVDSKNEWMHYKNAADSAYAMGEYESAIICLDKSYDTVPNNHSEKSKIKAKISAVSVHLLKFYEDMIRQEPSDTLSRYYLAQAYLRVGGVRQAMEQYYRILEYKDSLTAESVWKMILKYVPEEQIAKLTTPQ